MVPVADGVTARSSGVRLSDLVAVPVDVGKHTAMASVRDFSGAVLAKPFEFDLDRRGVDQLVSRVRGVVPATVSLIRVGLEAAGHYHLPLAGGALPDEWELRLLNPGHVAMQRNANGQRGVKTDRVDLVAITDLLLAGRGTIAPAFADPVMSLAGWVAHRRRRSLVRRRYVAARPGVLGEVVEHLTRASQVQDLPVGGGVALRSVASGKQAWRSMIRAPGVPAASRRPVGQPWSHAS